VINFRAERISATLTFEELHRSSWLAQGTQRRFITGQAATLNSA
jgi:hypothetical protein